MNRPRTIICLAVLTILMTTRQGSAQTPGGVASLSGFVRDAETQETLVSATVAVRGTKLGVMTNKSGFYSIRNIPDGTRTIVVSSVGYEKQEIPLEFAAGEAKKLDVTMKPKSIQAQEVTVTADKDAEKREIVISRINIPMEQLKELRVGGEADVFRSLQYLPGILSSSQISSGLYIRGGSPDQNLVLLDGSTVYNPSHLLGFLSTFNPDAIKDVDLIKGGFPAEYGGRLSAVINLTQKDGNRNKFEGVGALGLISSRLSLQGPLGDGAWFIGGRRTYLDLILGLLPEDKQNPLPSFNFYDLNAKVSQTLSPNDRVYLSGFLSRDQLGLDGSGLKVDIGIGNKSAAARWTHTFGDNLFTTVNLSASRYDNGFDGNNSGFRFKIENTITDYTIKANAEWYASDAATVKVGTENTRYVFSYLQNFTGNDSNAQQGSVANGSTNLTVYDWVHSGFVQTNYQLTDLFSLQAGLRADYLSLRNVFTFDPRLAGRYQFTEDFALRAAWGIYHQYLRLASQPDFSFFDTWLPTDSSVTPSISTHYILGVETSPMEGYDLNVEGYYKKLTNISELNQYATSASNVAGVFFSGDGQAYGAEIFLQKKTGRLTGWLGYGLGFISEKFDSINGGQSFRPKYDRRHDLKVVAQYRLDDRWELGGSFTFQSGQSYTAATSRFRSTMPDEVVGIDLTVPGQRYGLRLPASHQLNLNANYTSTLFGLPMRLLIDIYNVYSRRDIWFRYYDATGAVTTVTDVRLLPILPAISLELKF